MRHDKSFTVVVEPAPVTVYRAKFKIAAIYESRTPLSGELESVIRTLKSYLCKRACCETLRGEELDLFWRLCDEI